MGVTRARYIIQLTPFFFFFLWGQHGVSFFPLLLSWVYRMDWIGLEWIGLIRSGGCTEEPASPVFLTFSSTRFFQKERAVSGVRIIQRRMGKGSELVWSRRLICSAYS